MLNYQMNYRIPFLGENIFVTMSAALNIKKKDYEVFLRAETTDL